MKTALPLVSAIVLLLAGCQKEERTVTVLVAATTIPPNTVVDINDIVPITLTMEEVQQRGLPLEYTMVRANDVKGRVTRAEIKEGEGFLSTKLYPVNRAELNAFAIVQAANPQILPDLKNGLARMAIMSREEHGCVRYEVYQATVNNQPGTLFCIISQWRRTDDYEAHRAGINYKEIFEKKVLPLAKVFEHQAVVVE